MSIKKLIICDDHKAYCDSLRQLFLAENWILEYSRTLEDLIKKLAEEGDDYFAIILDIKGLIDNKQAKEHESFIGTALTFLDKNYPGMPRVILSGEKDDFKSVQRFHQNENVFQKVPDDQDELQTLLKEYAENSEIYKVRANEPVLYEIFDNGYLKNGSKSKLDNVLKHKLAVEKMPSGQLFNQCREVMEDIFKALNQKSSAYIADELFTGEKMNQLGCIQYLSGRKVRLKNFQNREISGRKIIPDFINAAFSCIYTNSGEGLHAGDLKPSNFTEMTTIYACLDCLRWFKSFMDSKDPYKD
jgi:hypothetical protein